MRTYKLGLYAQYDKKSGIFTGTTKVKYSNDIYKSNISSQSFKYILITENEEELYKDKTYFIIPEKLEGFKLATCDICEFSGDSEEFYHINEGDEDEHCTQCWDCV